MPIGTRFGRIGASKNLAAPKVGEMVSYLLAKQLGARKIFECPITMFGLRVHTKIHEAVMSNRPVLSTQAVSY